jgi:hypothetical protein
LIYIHQRPDWPAFRWDAAALATPLATPLAAVRHHQGRVLGRMQALGFQLQAETTLLPLTQDALKTSEIEGEVLDQAQVWSSLARRLGLATAAVLPVSRQAEAIATVVLDAAQNSRQPLTRVLDCNVNAPWYRCKQPHPDTPSIRPDERRVPVPPVVMAMPVVMMVIERAVIVVLHRLQAWHGHRSGLRHRRHRQRDHRPDQAGHRPFHARSLGSLAAGADRRAGRTRCGARGLRTVTGRCGRCPDR